MYLSSLDRRPFSAAVLVAIRRVAANILNKGLKLMTNEFVFCILPLCSRRSLCEIQYYHFADGPESIKSQ
jgi:hypothetical protein